MRNPGSYYEVSGASYEESGAYYEEFGEVACCLVDKLVSLRSLTAKCEVSGAGNAVQSPSKARVSFRSDGIGSDTYSVLPLMRARRPTFERCISSQAC